MKILIAYDGSKCADVALRDLKRAGLPEKAESLVISVAEVWLPPPSSYEILGEDSNGSLSKRQDHAYKLARDGAERIRALFPGWEVVALSDTGSPAGNVLEHAQSFRPDLILVGSHGFSTVERVALGSVSQRIVTEAQCSVRVARGRVDEEPQSPVRIVIGIDGSEDSQYAVDAVAGRNWPKGSEVRLVTCAGPYNETPVESEKPDMLGAIEKMLQVEADKLRKAGLEVTTKISFENPKKVIVDEAQSWGADSIFVGSRGLGRFSRFLLGSVSAAVTVRANCSVEVVRRNPEG